MLRKNGTTQLIEAVIHIAAFLLFIHLNTHAGTTLSHILLSLIILAPGMVVIALPTGSVHKQRFLIAGVLAALGLGFWVFNLMRYFGWVRWPLAHAETLREYLKLTYYHIIMSLTVLAVVLAAIYKTGLTDQCRFGSWRFGLYPSRTKMALSAVAVLYWILAIYTLVIGQHHSKTVFSVFLLFALAKSFITAITEEAVHRGIIQSAAVRRFGAVGGIFFSAAIYAAFHFHLGAFLLNPAGFLAAVFALGLLFGWVTYRTKGIGWAILVHAAIGVMIEWNNLS